MTQEDKELLLKELCARLPYGVKIELTNKGYHHENIAKRGDKTIDTLKGFTGKYFTIHHDNPLDWDWADNEIEVEDIKPYLFPMSSITEEKVYEFFCKFVENDIPFDDFVTDYWNTNSLNKVLTSIDDVKRVMDWFNENHVDYRRLIDKGSAVDATGLNIY